MLRKTINEKQAQSWLGFIQCFHMARILFLALSISLLLSGCAFRSIRRHKNIIYQAADQKIPAQGLNIFAPRIRKEDSLHEVLLYIHGGNWINGKKKLYNWLGSRWARKGVVMVVVDYPLSPLATNAEMAHAVAEAAKWVQDHIKQYGGNPEKIFISGHSAGGQLAALVAIDNGIWKPLGIANPIKGAILIDAAGLDIVDQMKEGMAKAQPSYLATFGADEAHWMRASPILHVHPGMPPILIYQGGATYYYVARGNEKFAAALRSNHANYQYKILPGKKHIPMITQFFNTSSPRYSEIKDWMNACIRKKD